MMTPEDREKLISEIIEMEMEMFKEVNPIEPSACQERLKTFRRMRWMSHSVMPETVLDSYRDDLRLARWQGRNFMTEKYARMAEQIPPVQVNERIERIADQEGLWLDEMRAKHPRTFPGNGEGFRVYITGELETYSPRTLELLEAFVVKAGQDGRNLVRERYENLFRTLGHASIEDFEAGQGK